MMRVQAACVPVALIASLAACSPQPSPAPVPQTSAAPPPAQPMAANATPSGQGQGGLDGVYRAPQGGVMGSRGCGNTRFGYPIRVANGMASMQTVSQGRLEGQVGPDGSLRIENGPAMLQGRFSGGQFNGTYSVAGRGSSCAFTLTYSK